MITSTAPRIAATDAAPIAAHERLAHMDVLRGFALFGILLVNMALFKAPAIAQAAAPAAGNLLGLTLSALLILAQTQLSLFAGLAALLLAHSLTGPLLALGYAATIVLLHEQPRWSTRLAPLGAAGRMALNNYLLQTVICTTLFYGYGAGLYGQIGAALGVLLSVVIFALQIVWSIWWLGHFRFGPAEWLWRTLTYGRAQPMRLRAEPARVR